MIIFGVVAPPSSWTSPSTNWLEHSALILAQCLFCCRPVGWTARYSPTSYSDQLVGLLGACRPVIPISWLDCSVLVDQSFRPVGWTARRSPTRCSDQLVVLLGARRPAVPTSWLDCSVLADQSFQPVGWTVQRSSTSCSDQLVGLLGICQPVIPTDCLGFIVSFTGVSPAELETPWRSSSSYKSF
jgi:hypothetical protein